MAQLHVDDLPADVRAQLGLPPKARRSTGVRREVSMRGASPTRCGTCKADFPSYSKAEKHLKDDHGGGGRLEAILEVS